MDLYVDLGCCTRFGDGGFCNENIFPSSCWKALCSLSERKFVVCSMDIYSREYWKDTHLVPVDRL